MSAVEGDLDLPVDCDEAIKQITDNGYARVMSEGYESQVVYGIAFFGKKALIKQMK